MKTVRTIRQVVERDEDVARRPELLLDDYVEVYSGQNEGHRFWIKDIRFNHDLDRFEYLYANPLMGGWHGENNIVLLERRVKKTGVDT